MSTEELKASANNFGFDASWIADILQKYGDDILPLVIEAARNGLSIYLIAETLQKFGPKVLDFLVSLLNAHNMNRKMGSAPGSFIEDVNSTVDVVIEKYLPMIIEKYLPIIIGKYGPQLVQLIVELVMKSLQK